MNISIERRRPESGNVLPPKGWSPRDETLRKSSVIPPGKVDVYYYGSGGVGKKPVDTKSQLARHLNEPVDVTPIDIQSNKILSNTQPITLHRNSSNLYKRKLSTIGSTSLYSPGGTSSTLRHHLEFSRGLRTDISLVPPIRQTASIFKQPVTVHKTQEGKVKHDLKHGTQDKPRQLFWEKRLEGLRSCDVTGMEFGPIDLPKSIKPVGPNVNEQTLLQSVATALHVSNQPVTGQMTAKQILCANTGVFLNPDQPLMHSVNVSEDDIRRQEDRVSLARRRLQEALKV
ncbi:methyl-CpG-binding domain protein 2 isoform X1 [Hermetia illucens]|uniref:methyl-CpG-binding domain protein 2 isoform X1 n=1 Tax=Hermetia illucens TaxID=343691 RepID=UPI0018CC3636|nr:methyl-CpG-binding domain protein 2 isoform X1 [Hermetia illucens]